MAQTAKTSYLASSHSVLSRSGKKPAKKFPDVDRGPRHHQNVISYCLGLRPSHPIQIHQNSSPQLFESSCRLTDGQTDRQTDKTKTTTANIGGGS